MLRKQACHSTQTTCVKTENLVLHCFLRMELRYGQFMDNSLFYSLPLLSAPPHRVFLFSLQSVKCVS